MLIKALTLENFKGIREPVRIEFKPITLLFGPNSAGKSTILQALVYAREIVERRNLDPDRTLLGGEWLDLGGFANLVHGHDRSKTIRIGFELDLQGHHFPSYLTENYYIGRDETKAEIDLPGPGYLPLKIERLQIQWAIKWNESQNKPYVESLRIIANAIQLATVTSSGDGKDVVIDMFNVKHPIFEDAEESVEHIPDTDWFFQICQNTISPQKKLQTPEFKSWSDRELKLIRRKPIDLAEALKASGNNAEKHIKERDNKTENNKERFRVWPAEELSDYYSRLPIIGLSDSQPRIGQPLNLGHSVWERKTEEDDWPYPASGTRYWFQDYISAVLSEIIVGPVDLIHKALNQLLYIGPLREVPSRRPSYLRFPDTSRWARGVAAWDVLHNADDAFIEQVNDWIADSKKLNTGYRIQLDRFWELPVDHPISLAISKNGIQDEEGLAEQLKSLPLRTRVILRDATTDLEVSPQDIGVGVSQVLPVVVAALHHKSGILAIEQPELHIHPALQVALGDLFAAQLPEKDVLYLLETHSEHLMLRFLRRIRETTEDELPPDAPALTPDQVAVYYVQNTKDGVTLTPLKVSEDGDFIDRWPGGFFDERAEELF